MAKSSESQRPGTLGGRLQAARRRRFVGREQEKELLRAALRAEEPPFALLHVHGPGGVGKSTLLSEFAALAGEEGWGAVLLDGRNIEPSPEGFLSALRQAQGLPEGAAPLAALGQGRPALLMVDTYENLAPLDGWLREVLLPQLPERGLAVFAGRNPPSQGWRTDAGWRDLVRPLSLRNLRPEESRDYLTRRGVPPERHRAVLEFTHGHPLALSLVAEVLEREGGYAFRPDAAPDVVRSLLERFVQQVPSPLHRAALEASALVRSLSEPLLAAALGQEDANPQFEWLRGLSFMESGPHGLLPHDLAREALDADLRWRNPDWYAELHRRVRRYYTAKLQETRGLAQQRVLADDVYLHRHNPLVKPFLEWGQVGSVFAERGRPDDHPAVLEMIRRHEGEAAAAAARHWLTLQPEGLTVYRGVGPEPAGALLLLRLHAAGPADLEADPVALRAWAYAQRHAPTRPGEEVSLFRFWLAREAYQGVSPEQSLIFLHAVQHYISNTRLAWSFFPAADPDFWRPAFLYMNIHQAEELGYEAGGRRAGVFAHDWRQQPAVAWLEMLGERELATLELTQLEAQRPRALVVLSQPEFEEAVKDALRDFARPEALAHSPLLRSRLLTEPTPKALRALLWEAAQALRASPKDEKLYRALERTYLDPAPTQEVAAELLGLPFSTYRRHLTGGLARLTELLWQRELYG